MQSVSLIWVELSKIKWKGLCEMSLKKSMDVFHTFWGMGWY